MIREYSEKKVPVAAFLDLLDLVCRKGWYKAGPADECNLELVPTVSFHVNLDDADKVYNILSSAVKDYNGGTIWSFQRTAPNRFFLCPKLLLDAGREEGEFTFQTAVNLRERSPEIGVTANADLLVLADYIYELLKRGK